MKKNEMVYNELIKKAKQAKAEAYQIVVSKQQGGDTLMMATILYAKAEAYQDAASYFGSVYNV